TSGRPPSWRSSSRRSARARRTAWRSARSEVRLIAPTPEAGPPREGATGPAALPADVPTDYPGRVAPPASRDGLRSGYSIRIGYSYLTSEIFEFEISDENSDAARPAPPRTRNRPKGPPRWRVWPVSMAS